MDKKALIILGLIVLACMVATYSLTFMALNVRQGSNGFLRHFANTPVLVPEDTLDLRYDSYYLAGHTKHTLFMGNVVAPRHVLSFNLDRVELQPMEIRIVEPQPLRTQYIQVAVDSPNIYLCEGTVPVIYEGDLGSLTVYPRGIGSTYFLDVVPAGGSSLLIKSLNHAKENILGRLTLEPFHVTFPGIDLKKQIDGLFCTDGQMVYDEKRHGMIYVYKYRNRILVLDSAFNVTCAGKTIDTISHARIEVATIASGNTVTLSSPPMVVNRNSCVNGNWLFVNSDLTADNENPDVSRKYSVIDVYTLPTLRYSYSFYVPDYDGRRVNNFAFLGGRLIAQYERYVIFFRVSLTI